MHERHRPSRLNTRAEQVWVMDKSQPLQPDASVRRPPPRTHTVLAGKALTPDCTSPDQRIPGRGCATRMSHGTHTRVLPFSTGWIQRVPCDRNSSTRRHRCHGYGRWRHGARRLCRPGHRRAGICCQGGGMGGTPLFVRTASSLHLPAPAPVCTRPWQTVERSGAGPQGPWHAVLTPSWCVLSADRLSRHWQRPRCVGTLDGGTRFSCLPSLLGKGVSSGGFAYGWLFFQRPSLFRTVTLFFRLLTHPRRCLRRGSGNVFAGQLSSYGNETNQILPDQNSRAHPDLHAKLDPLRKDGVFRLVADRPLSARLRWHFHDFAGQGEGRRSALANSIRHPCEALWEMSRADAAGRSLIQLLPRIRIRGERAPSGCFLGQAGEPLHRLTLTVHTDGSH
jgi:hypothetical protein